ncbi:hypothetical protein [Pseudoduganella sp. UC29_71]|uniref:hypothetical protein n=1 Tax=Pseudoduganella sp. UC29_71 TaxID=3350174 RepID=UPI00366E30FF
MPTLAQADVQHTVTRLALPGIGSTAVSINNSAPLRAHHAAGLGVVGYAARRRKSRANPS